MTAAPGDTCVAGDHSVRDRDGFAATDEERRGPDTIGEDAKAMSRGGNPESGSGGDEQQ